MTQHDSTLTAQPPQSTDEQVALRARELYAQYAESTRTPAEPATKPARRRAPRKSPRAGTRPADAATATQDDIALRAYMLFEEAGRPEGRDVEFWLEAERQLTGTRDA